MIIKQKHTSGDCSVRMTAPRVSTWIIRGGGRSWAIALGHVRRKGKERRKLKMKRRWGVGVTKPARAEASRVIIS